MPSTADDRIDGLTTSVAIKAPCVVATTAAITLAGEQTIAGIALVTGDRVLVKDQANTVDNGIYVVNTNPWVRSRDFDGARDAVQGTLVLVYGATAVGSLYRLTTANPVNFGVSPITFILDVFGSVDSAAVSFLPAGTNAVARTGQSKWRDIVSDFDFMTVAQIADVRAGTTLLDVAAAMQSALTYAGSVNYTLWSPSGIRLTTATLTVPNNVKWIGDGKDNQNILGTQIKYTGASDAIQIINPINSSTAAQIAFEDMSIRCTVTTAGKASIADTGSTFLSFLRIGVVGNAFGIILDQSEIVSICECDVEVNGATAAATAGIWLVNGAEHTGGASSFFTNHITIEKTQFNGASGIGIVDDGGAVHHFIRNNFNLLTTHIRVCGAYGLVIRENEFEQSSSFSLNFQRTRLGGAANDRCTTVEIANNFYAATAAITFENFAATAVDNLSRRNNHYNNTNAGGAPVVGILAGVNVNYYGMGNSQYGIGSGITGNNSGLNGIAYNPAAVQTGFNAGVGGSLTGEYTREPGVVVATINCALGAAGMTMGTNAAQLVAFTLPFAGSNARLVNGALGLVAAGLGVPGSAYTNSPATTTGPFIAGAAPFMTVGAAVWANGDFFRATVAYPVSTVTGMP